MSKTIRNILIALAGIVAMVFGVAGPAQAGSYNLAVYCAYPGGNSLAKQYDGSTTYVDACLNKWGIASFYVPANRRVQYRTSGVVYWTSCSWTLDRGLYFTMNANTALLDNEYCG